MSQDSRKDLQCTICNNLTYSTKINPKGKAKMQAKMARLEISKYCKYCKKHNLHKETK